MDFQQSLAYLYSLGNEVLAMKLGLESTRRLLAALGDPQEHFLKIQIAGTNGKGSTCAFLDAMCRSAGIKTGLTTSPHLISITERIRVDGSDISEEKFAEHATRIRDISEGLVAGGELESVPTFFEQVTAIAISAFAEAGIRLAILETGLGGGFDSVTATRAEIVGITPIDYDHQQILGNTLRQIAAEKAAVIREDTKVFVSPQKKEAEQVILGRCRQLNVEPVFVTADVRVDAVLDDWGVYPFPLLTTLITNRKIYPKIRLSLLGKHQFVNAALAANIAGSLNEFDLDVDDADITRGLETAEHKGRLEFYKGILFDGAHNISGALALKKFLDEFIEQPLAMVFGAMKDKDVSEIAEILFPKAQTLILTRPDNPRAMEVEELLKFVPPDFNRGNLVLAETVGEAMEVAPYHAMHGVVCVTGSLYLVGEAQKILGGHD